MVLTSPQARLMSWVRAPTQREWAPTSIANREAGRAENFRSKEAWVVGRRASSTSRPSWSRRIRWERRSNSG